MHRDNVIHMQMKRYPHIIVFVRVTDRYIYGDNRFLKFFRNILQTVFIPSTHSMRESGSFNRLN